MKFKIRWTHRIDTVYQLHDIIFPGDELPELENAIHWVVYDENDTPVGFTILRELSGLNKGSYFLSRAGIIKRCRGKGIHRRLVKVRENYVKNDGGGTLVTYVAYSNPSSYCSLIRSGYLVYEPDCKYVGSGFMYLKKSIKP